VFIVLVIVFFLVLLGLVDRKIKQERKVHASRCCEHGVAGDCDQCCADASERIRLAELQWAESIRQQYLSIPEDIRNRLTKFAIEHPERNLALTGTTSIELAVIAMYQRSPLAAKYRASLPRDELGEDS